MIPLMVTVVIWLVTVILAHKVVLMVLVVVVGVGTDLIGYSGIEGSEL